MGPVSFINYINGINNAIEIKISNNIKLFADDTNLKLSFFKHKDFQKL